MRVLDQMLPWKVTEAPRALETEAPRALETEAPRALETVHSGLVSIGAHYVTWACVRATTMTNLRRHLRRHLSYNRMH